MHTDVNRSKFDAQIEEKCAKIVQYWLDFLVHILWQVECVIIEAAVPQYDFEILRLSVCFA